MGTVLAQANRGLGVAASAMPPGVAIDTCLLTAVATAADSRGAIATCISRPAKLPGRICSLALVPSRRKKPRSK